MIKKTLPKIRTVVVWGRHRLSHGDMIREKFKRPYLGNPFMRVRDTENVQIRFIFHDSIAGN